MSLYDRVFNEAITYGPMSFSSRKIAYPDSEALQGDPVKGLRRLRAKQREQSGKKKKGLLFPFKPPTNQ